MAAQVEEVVVDANLVEFEDPGPDISEDLLDGGSWSGKGIVEFGSGLIGSRQAFRSSLPLGVSGSESRNTKADGTM